MFTLEKLLTLAAPDIADFIEKEKVRIVRHTMDGNISGNWGGFDEKLKFDQLMLERFTAGQVRDVFGNAEVIIVFVKTSNTRCILRGAFYCHGLIDKPEFDESYKKVNLEYNLFRKENGIEPAESIEKFYYKLEPLAELDDLKNRLIIEWGNAGQVWVQKKLSKEVWQILPPGFVSYFPGWENVYISHQELKSIIENPGGNTDWHQFLTEHDGVYVIRDTKNNQLYVGSAYGSNGLWGRWSGYARTGHNENLGLKNLIELNPAHCDYFTYSIHHAFPKSAKSEDKAIEYESLLKRKLGPVLNHN